MARYVRVAAVGPSPCKALGSERYGELVKRMRRHWTDQLRPVLADHPDLIVLHEACDRYSDHTLCQRAAYYRERGDSMRAFFQDMARENHCHIAYSAARELEDGTWRNSTQLIGRNGEIEGVYNKNHLVVNEGAPDSPTPMLCGRDAPVFELDFGRVACVICFDLNFETLRQRYRVQRPELILFSSMYHGGFVQREWAYGCRSYFVGAVCGQTCSVLNPLGEEAARSSNYFSFVSHRINLDYAVVHLDFNWEKIAAAKAKYGEKLGFFDPGQLGAVLLTSESDEFSIGEIMREFDIEPLDHYFERSIENQKSRTEC